MEKVSLKSVSVESFAKFGFWSGVTLGIIGVIVKLLFPMSKISAGIPFFAYNPTASALDLLVFFVIAVVFTAIDFIIIALFINLFLKLSNGVDFYVEKGE
jgi:hypothetical protein